MSGDFVNLRSKYYQAGTIPLLEYPRPHFERDSYFSLNGPWHYAISKDAKSQAFAGEIIVPFSPEALLSGVNRRVKHDEYLIYERNVVLPKGFKKEHLILHFGAVDQTAHIYIDNNFVAKHHLPFFPFSVDITKFVKSNKFTLRVVTKDVTHRGNTFVGKQKEKRGGIWYTPQTGIWQSVWLESLPKAYLENVAINPSFDEKTVTFTFAKVGKGDIAIKIYAQNKLIETIRTSDDEIRVTFRDINAWSPETPFLYDVEFTFNEDIVKSYFAFRKISKALDKNGIMRFCLNDEPVFQSGILDQGYYSDGLLTAPSDQALIDDIMLVKKMGFNMIRKHIKMESLRFYYHCDRLGMLVWQDMINLVPPALYNVNGAKAMFFGRHHRDIKTKRYGVKNAAQRKIFERGLDELINVLKFFPSIVTWVPFNEGWGQFNAKSAVKRIKELDNTRLIDHASGWSDQGISDYYSEHIYFKKLKLRPRKIKNRIIAITEFGGYSYKVNNHIYNRGKTFGYRIYKEKTALMNGFENLYLKEALPLINRGLNVLIYTQLSDVEDEVNGLVTFDRKVIKFDINKVKKINMQLYHAFADQKK
ncbi:MAG TPA: glycoside hydrolase family 2 TIM barrel-domain containing protein [Bacilli bacterium]|nr:glycoside hydrolase family 2 TIM barrel-domain containing protein [Bacilli bacterium]